jgi:hypothetical protein
VVSEFPRAYLHRTRTGKFVKKIKARKTWRMLGTWISPLRSAFTYLF